MTKKKDDKEKRLLEAQILAEKQKHDALVRARVERDTLRGIMYQ